MRDRETLSWSKVLRDDASASSGNDGRACRAMRASDRVATHQRRRLDRCGVTTCDRSRGCVRRVSPKFRLADNRPSCLHLLRYPPAFACCDDKRRITAKRRYLGCRYRGHRLLTADDFVALRVHREADASLACAIYARFLITANRASINLKKWDRAAKRFDKSTVSCPEVNCLGVYRPTLHFRSWVCAKAKWSSRSETLSKRTNSGKRVSTAKERIEPRRGCSLGVIPLESDWRCD